MTMKDLNAFPYVSFRAHKASNNIVFDYKVHYRNCHIMALGIDINNPGYAKYKGTTFDKDEILNNHKCSMSSKNIDTSRTCLPCIGFPNFIRIHTKKGTYLHTCSTKEMSIHLTKMVSAVKN